MEMAENLEQAQLGDELEWNKRNWGHQNQLMLELTDMCKTSQTEHQPVYSSGHIMF